MSSKLITIVNNTKRKSMKLSEDTYQRLRKHNQSHEIETSNEIINRLIDYYDI
jgi:hypothetical protein